LWSQSFSPRFSGPLQRACGEAEHRGDKSAVKEAAHLMTVRGRETGKDQGKADYFLHPDPAFHSSTTSQ
jgi:hypothetical protein